MKVEPREDVMKVEPREDVMKVEPREDVIEEPKSCLLSAQRSGSFVRDYRPTFHERKRYRFVPKPTV